MSASTIGFVGLGRLGTVLATLLLEGGVEVVCCKRGRSAELTSRGARIPGDGSPSAVAAAANAVFTCLPSERALDDVVFGADGILAVDGPAPTVVELSTLPIVQMERVRDSLVARGGELLDCPVSGTPAMAAAREAVVYASGDRAAFDRLQSTIGVCSPKVAYVGELGAGTKLKYIANTLAFIHIVATAEAMAFAGAAGLDQQLVVDMLGRSPAVTSGQFAARAPMIAAGRFDSSLVTIDMTCKDLTQITAFAQDIGAPLPLLSVVDRAFAGLVERGEGGSEPAKLSLFLLEEARAARAAMSRASDDSQ